MFSLRPDQLSLTGKIRERFSAGVQSVLAVAPCGFGKTICFASLTTQAYKTGRRVMALVHREELLDQVSDTFAQFNVEHGCIAPGRPNHRNRPIQIASVFSLCRRLADYEPPDLLIIDEAHHATAGSWKKIFSAWPDAYRLGVTASPERLNGQGLGDIFKEMIVGPSVRELIDRGSLSAYKIFAPPTNITDGIHRRAGDYDRKELGAAVDKPTITGDAIQHYRKICDGKRALVFCVSIEHAQHIAEDFTKAGYRAAKIDGKMHSWERRKLVNDFRSGSIQILTSCDIISEGFDLPAVEVAILLRPTQSLVLFTQQVGRALRPYPGKPHAIILDHAGNTHRHGLPDDAREWSLDGKEMRQASKSDGPNVSVRTCGQCFAAVRSPAPVCQYCGWQFPIKPREVEEVEGTLEEVDKALLQRQKRVEVGRAKDMEALLAIQRQRGYRSGWSYYVWQARQRKHARG
jgi:superfamily II DNA or RNA helicase